MIHLYNITSLRITYLFTFANFPLSPPTDIDRLLVIDPFRFSDMMKDVNILTMTIYDASVIVKKSDAYLLFEIIYSLQSYIYQIYSLSNHSINLLGQTFS